MRLAKPTAEDILTDLIEEQLDGVRRRKYLIYYRKTRHGKDILHTFHGARSQRSAVKAARKRR